MNLSPVCLGWALFIDQVHPISTYKFAAVKPTGPLSQFVVVNLVTTWTHAMFQSYSFSSSLSECCDVRTCTVQEILTSLINFQGLVRCRVPITEKDLKPNLELKARIEAWRSQNAADRDAMEE